MGPLTPRLHLFCSPQIHFHLMGTGTFSKSTFNKFGPKSLQLHKHPFEVVLLVFAPVNKVFRRAESKETTQSGKQLSQHIILHMPLVFIFLHAANSASMLTVLFQPNLPVSFSLSLMWGIMGLQDKRFTPSTLFYLLVFGMTGGACSIQNKLLLICALMKPGAFPSALLYMTEQLVSQWNRGVTQVMKMCFEKEVMEILRPLQTNSLSITHNTALILHFS